MKKKKKTKKKKNNNIYNNNDSDDTGTVTAWNVRGVRGRDRRRYWWGLRGGFAQLWILRIIRRPRFGKVLSQKIAPPPPTTPLLKKKRVSS